MNCPKCAGPTKVTDSRPDCGRVRRRRKCLLCHKMFTTFEAMAGQSVGSGPQDALAAVRSALAIMDEAREELRAKIVRIGLAISSDTKEEDQ